MTSEPTAAKYSFTHKAVAGSLGGAGGDGSGVTVAVGAASPEAELAKWKALAETLAGALGEAVTWNSHDDEGVAAVWLDAATQALTSYKEQRDAS